MLLDTTTRSVEVLLLAAITTNQLEVTANWTDNTGTTFAAGTTRVVTNSTTAVTAVAAPAASTWRKVMEVSIFNADTVTATATVRLNDSGAFSRYVQFVIPTGQTLQYTDASGWGLIATVVSIGPAGPAGPAGATGAMGPLASGFAGVNAQSGTTYTPVLADAGYNITLSNAAAITLTVPTFASVAYATGTVIGITQIAAGQVTVVGAGGVTINSASSLKTRTQFSICGLICEGVNTWTFGGDIT